MDRTSQFSLPLLIPAQAQKHVTVNEALLRLDAAAQLSVISSTLVTPPAAVVEGSSFIVPPAATGAWLGKQGQIAVWSNGAWMFLAPKAGWRAWEAARSGIHLYNGADWIADAVAASPNGAATCCAVIEFDHAISPGNTNATSVKVPAQGLVFGVTGRVLSDLRGSGLTGWRIGVSGSDNRYGSGLGLSANSYLVGLSGSPVTYYADTPLLITAEGAGFVEGSIRLALHVFRILPPRAD